MTATALSLAGEGLRWSYRRGSFTLDVPWVEVSAGTVLALLGPSGSGKSTLLSVLGLLERPSAGRVLLDGREVDTRDRGARLQMAAVFQRPYLFKGTVGGNVAYGLVARRVPRSQHAARVAAVLERVGLAGSERRSALALSGGEAQRVALARALVVEPRVLLLDEPLASLDPLLKRQLTADFASILRASGVTVLYVTHDQNEAMVIADRVAIMNGGCIVAEGPAEDAMSLPNDAWTASFLGLEEPSEGLVVSVVDGLAEVDVGAGRVFITGQPEAGSRIMLAVRPEDVLLFGASADLPVSTARNRLPATVVSLSAQGVTNHVVLDAGGLRLASSVSRAATAELGLRSGVEVIAVFKASAVRWVPART
ncbi:MAG: ABC transporter ATP-binding protein [Coriobacteriia bacterium]|nr:ABC transporter ATP-binding protein [Coriobacteriia bacterium]